jgi:hypothetical protein
MAKWYLGIVKSYDPARDLHHVDYKDGDAQDLCLRQQPVVCADDDHSRAGSEQHAGGTPVQGGTPHAPCSALSNGRRSAAGDAAAVAAGQEALSQALHKAAGAVQPEVLSDTAARGDQRAKQQQQQQQGAAAERTRRGRTPPQHAAAAPLNGGPSPSAASGSSHDAGQQQQQQHKAAPNGHARAHSADEAEGERAAKRARHSGPRPSSGKAASLIETKVMLVGCRVGIYWEMDAIFYRVGACLPACLQAGSRGAGRKDCAAEAPPALPAQPPARPPARPPAPSRRPS